jgi:HPt (histidine-containing phosphotransfer) domain-containing protein
MPNPPPPNRAIAELVHGLGDEDARELVGMFLKGFDSMLAALAAEDREEQRRAAHSLKSSARIVGLMELAHQMSELETRLARPEGAVTTDDVSAARQNFEEDAATLRAFANSHAG